MCNASSVSTGKPQETFCRCSSACLIQSGVDCLCCRLTVSRLEVAVDLDAALQATTDYAARSARELYAKFDAASNGQGGRRPTYTDSVSRTAGAMQKLLVVHSCWNVACCHSNCKLDFAF